MYDISLMSKAEMISTLASYMKQQQDCTPDNTCAEIVKNEAIEFAEFSTQFIPTLNSNDGNIVWFNKQENIMLTTADLYSLFKQEDK